MSMSRIKLPRVALAALCLVGLAMSVCAAGDDPAPAPRKGKGPRALAVRDSEMPVKGLTPDQQQQALEFAQSQHPQLAELLGKLKESNPKEFGRALNDLYRAQQRLSRLADQNPERFALEVGLWKVQSRIRLLTAQLVMDGDTANDESLKSLLSDRRNLKIESLQFDRGRTAERLANLDQQLAELQRDPQGDNEKELSKLMKTVGKQAKAKKTRSKPATEGMGPAELKPKKKSKAKDKDATQ